MDISVHVDEFLNYPGNCRNTVYLLTHAHLDHVMRIRKAFACRVHCTPITKKLLPETLGRAIIVDDLVPDAWVVVDDILVFCFAAHHCIGSVGFFVPCTNKLYVGEGRINKPVLANIQRAIALFVGRTPPSLQLADDFVQTTQSPKRQFPSLMQTRRMLLACVAEQRGAVRITLSHFGILGVLPRQLRYRFLRSDKPSGGESLLYAAFQMFGFQQGEIEVCHAWSAMARNRTDPVRFVYLSASWWFSQQRQDLDVFAPYVYPDGDIRIFACGHASLDELDAVRRAFQAELPFGS